MAQLRAKIGTNIEHARLAAEAREARMDPVILASQKRAHAVASKGSLELAAANATDPAVRADYLRKAAQAAADAQEWTAKLAAAKAAAASR